MRQQQVIRGQDGMEFIVETKIKTVDGRVMTPAVASQPPPPTQTQTQTPQPPTDRNYFMRTFDNTPQTQTNADNEPSHRPSHQTSSFIKIPLLNSRYLEKPERETVHQETRHAKLPYLDPPTQPASISPLFRPPVTQM